MAVAISHSYSTGTAGAASLTQAITVDASTDVVIVTVGANYGANNYTTGVTVNGDAMTLIGQIPGTTGYDFGNVSIWKLTTPDTGNIDVVASFVASNRTTHMGVYVLTGVDSSDVNGTPVFNFAGAGSTSISKAITAGVTGSIIIDCLGKNLTAVPSVTGDNTLLGTSNGNGSSYKTDVTATSSYTFSWSFTANIAGIMVVEIKAAASSSAIKTINGLAKASVKTHKGLAIASVKTINGLA